MSLRDGLNLCSTIPKLRLRELFMFLVFRFIGGKKFETTFWVLVTTVVSSFAVSWNNTASSFGFFD